MAETISHPEGYHYHFPCIIIIAPTTTGSIFTSSNTSLVHRPSGWGGGSYGPRVTLRIQISYELSPWMIITCTHLFTYASQYPCQKIILPVDKAYILHSTLPYWSPQTIFPILLLADIILGMVTYSLLQVNVVPVVFVFLPKKLCPTSLPEFIQLFLLDLYSFFT